VVATAERRLRDLGEGAPAAEADRTPICCPRRHGETMRRSTFLIFGLVAVALAIAVPFWAISREGNADEPPPDARNALASEGMELFVINCGGCHTLAEAGTDGVVGPNLDELLAPPGPTQPDPAAIKTRVLAAVQNGINGRMPAGILSGEQADAVATYVADVAGQ
jgi:mono/diheme cytochrome c family protein